MKSGKMNTRAAPEDEKEAALALAEVVAVLQRALARTLTASSAERDQAREVLNEALARAAQEAEEVPCG